MRVLATAINEGEHKVPEGHKVTRYALAPGRALKINEAAGDTEVVTVGKAECLTANYTHLLKWIEGRTVALFRNATSLYAQPTKDGPAQKRRKDAEAPGSGDRTDDRGPGGDRAVPGREPDAVARPHARRRSARKEVLFDGEGPPRLAAGGGGAEAPSERVTPRRRKPRSGGGLLL